MTIYRGYPFRTRLGGFTVTKDEIALNPMPSQKVYNHSPNGFSWGYGGSGPAQLALALLLEETDEQMAIANYQQFKWDVVAQWPMDSTFEITSEDIQTWLAAQKGTGE